MEINSLHSMLVIAYYNIADLKMIEEKTEIPHNFL